MRGRDLLYRYCSEHKIPHKQIGKLIVATGNSEVPKLNELLSRGVQNGVEGLRMVDGDEAMRMEPELQCVKALLSPLSGIIDSHSFMLSLVVRIKLDIYTCIPSSTRDGTEFYMLTISIIFFFQL